MTANAMLPQPSRQSCDRCHGQKLRCSRAVDADHCTRCLRQGVQSTCHFSAPLPKGRPNRAARADASTSTSTSTSTPPSASIASVSNASDASSASTASTSSSAPVYPSAGAPQPQSRVDTQSRWMQGDIWPWDGSDAALATAAFFDAHVASLGEPRVPSPSPDSLELELEPWLWPARVDDDIDVAIAQLSELSSGLYSLYRASLAVMPPQTAHVGPLIGDAALEAVTTWLVAPSNNAPRCLPLSASNTLQNTLQNTLSVSRRMLQIMRRLHATRSAIAEPAQPSHSHPNPAPASTPTWEDLHIDFFGSITPTSAGNSLRDQDPASIGLAPPGPGGRYSDAIIQHLVLACHTLLLNTYNTLLVALQHDANLQRDASSTSDVDTAALADMRLVMIVQLNSYFIDRLHQAVDAYLSFQRCREMGGGAPAQQDMPASITTKLGALSELETEVQQRLQRLRQTLRI
ncbi:hypothetical protein N431DRAFT_482539 [Stipitochalara longipes BDJ]|nr:hypothetical protein N431DRAFT_482539 [Stipitochalara longipes BDJ]